MKPALRHENSDAKKVMQVDERNLTRYDYDARKQIGNEGVK
jgi:hypothetical protein